MKPILFQIFNFKVSSYIFFITLGFCLALFVFIQLTHKEGFDRVNIFFTATIGMIFIYAFSFVFKNLLSIIEHFEAFKQNPFIFIKSMHCGGSTILGTIIGLLLFFKFYLQVVFKEKSHLLIAPAIVAFPLGQAVGRIGCLLTGCCYGRPTDLFWAVKLDHMGQRVHPLAHFRLHPVQIYEAVLNLINFIILYMVYKKKKPSSKKMIAYYLINYSLIRFFSEYFRGDVKYILKGSSSYTSLTLFQIICLMVIALGLTYLFIKKKRSVQ